MKNGNSKNDDVQTMIYRRMKPWQRLAAARDLYWFARGIIKARERALHKGLDSDELERRVRSFF